MDLRPANVYITGPSCYFQMLIYLGTYVPLNVLCVVLCSAQLANFKGKIVLTKKIMSAQWFVRSEMV